MRRLAYAVRAAGDATAALLLNHGTDYVYPPTNSGYNRTHFSSEESAVGNSQSIPFRYELDVSGDTTTVICHGRITGENSGELKQLVKPMIPRVRRIVLDLSDVSFIDSAGLGALVSLKASAASAAYCTLQLVNFSPLVKELLQTTKLSQLLGAA